METIFYGQNLQNLLDYKKLRNGAKIVLHKVKKPELYGVAKINKSNKVISIKEKPKKFFSDLAITGLYFFDNLVCKYSKLLKPSKRGELEIVDLINKYRKKGSLKASLLGRGGAWLDTGSIDDFTKLARSYQQLRKGKG